MIRGKSGKEKILVRGKLEYFFFSQGTLFKTRQQSEGHPYSPPQNPITLKCNIDFE